MILVLGLAAALWGVGALLGAPARQRAGVLGALWVVVVLEHLLLPDGHPLRAATGGDARPWVILGGLGALVVGYRGLLRRARARHAAMEPAAPAAPAAAFRPVELDRYARHIALREIGGAGQRRLKAARVLVVGAGGLGSPALLYLAGAGVGTIGVIDDDVVENANLQRQIIHADERIGMAKAHSAAAAMRALNPFVEVRPYARRLEAPIAADLFADYDLVLDGSDDWDTRELVNATCVAARLPLVSGAITQWEGQVALFDPAHGGPCRACLFPARPAPGLAPTCAEAGVAAPLPGVIGSIMATEAVKHLTGAGTTLRGRLLVYDALEADMRVIRTHKRGDCPVCGTPRPVA